MAKKIILLLLITSSRLSLVEAQMDTLVLSPVLCPERVYNDYYIEDSLLNSKGHFFCFDLERYSSQNKYCKKIMKLLDKRLKEVKVLYLLNPTGLYEKNELAMGDTSKSLIYKVDFKKMTSLKTYIF